MLPINRNPAAREVRAFTRIWLPLFVVVFGGVLWWRGASPLTVGFVWGVGGMLVALALASREAARVIFVGLMTVTYPIGLVVSTVVLGFMFYLVFTPLGFFMRLAGRDPLRLKARGDRTHWMPHEQDDTPERAFRQY
jgi:hypothetical protein